MTESATEMKPLKITVGIATAGRPAVLAETVAFIMKQSRPPDEFIICPASDADVPPDWLEAAPAGVRLIRAGRGLCVQRNGLLSVAGDADWVVFFDDDFFPSPHYLERLEKFCRQRQDIAMVTGLVLADGVNSGGIAPEEAQKIIESKKNANITGEVFEEFGAYGCNMAINGALFRKHDIRFDENLPLYGWFEDQDFSRQMARYGRIVRATDMTGVHLGVKSGRSPGRRLGYSQVANPIYLYRKGTLPFGRAASQVLRHVAKNCVWTLKPEPWVDRAGRMRGNFRALADLCTGRLNPMRVLDVDFSA